MGPCLIHFTLKSGAAISLCHTGLQRSSCVLSDRGSATLGQGVSRSKRRPSAHCPGGPPWRISGNLGRGGKGLSSLQGAEVMCPKRTLATLSLDLPSRPPNSWFHFHQGQEKWKGLKVEIRKLLDAEVYCLWLMSRWEGKKEEMLSSDFTIAERAWPMWSHVGHNNDQKKKKPLAFMGHSLCARR